MPRLEIAAEVSIGDHKINNALLGRYVVQVIKVGLIPHQPCYISLSLYLFFLNPNCKNIYVAAQHLENSCNIIKLVQKVHLVVTNVVVVLCKVGLIGNTLRKRLG